MLADLAVALATAVSSPASKTGESGGECPGDPDVGVREASILHELRKCVHVPSLGLVSILENKRNRKKRSRLPLFLSDRFDLYHCLVLAVSGLSSVAGFSPVFENCQFFAAALGQNLGYNFTAS